MDIQDLLNEVEEVMQDRSSAATKKDHASRSTPVESSSCRGASAPVSSSSSSSSRPKSLDDIDDLLSMIDCGDDSSSTAAVHPRHGNNSASGVSSTTTTKATARAEEFQVTSGSKKCSTLMLGGESAKRGVNTAFMAHTTCANLRCNECDFTVVQLLGKKWSASADYMFFRENVPNEAKLRARMESAPGSAAYACQCKWLSIDVQTRVDMCRIKWSCAGH